MQAAQKVAGYTLGGADLLRRAMGKKDKEKMAKERVKFCEGAATLHGLSADKANEIFDTLEKFAGYGFNRSHSAAYAWVSYQTAYLKANYPVEFMAAVLSNEVSNTDKISIFVAECERLGIKILPPDLNKSGLKFTAEEVSDEGLAAAAQMRKTLLAAQAAVAEAKARKKAGEPEEEAVASISDEPASDGQRIHVGSIRYGLAAIKNVGEVAMEATIAERTKSGDFKSLDDFCARVDSKKINKKAVECLVKCGALDFTGMERAQLHSEIDAALAAASSAHRDRASGQVSLFDDMMSVAKPPASKRNGSAVPPWGHTEKLAFEKELLGFYVTGHPLDEYRSLLDSDRFVPIAKLAEQENKSNITIAGQLAVVERKFTKKDGKPFAIVTLEDLTAQIEVMIWNETFNKTQKNLEAGKVVSISGRLDLREEGPRLTADKVEPLGKPTPKEKPLVLTLDCTKATEADFLRIRDVLTQNPGSRRVELRLASEGKLMRLLPREDYKITLTPEATEQLAEWMS